MTASPEIKESKQQLQRRSLSRFLIPSCLLVTIEADIYANYLFFPFFSFFRQVILLRCQVLSGKQITGLWNDGCETSSTKLLATVAMYRLTYCRPDLKTVWLRNSANIYPFLAHVLQCLQKRLTSFTSETNTPLYFIEKCLWTTCE